MGQARRIRDVEIAARFGDNLAACRRRANLSQEELGWRAGLHRTAIGQLERGQRVARVDTLVRLAGALSVSPAELLDGLTWVPPLATGGRFAIAPADPAENR